MITTSTSTQNDLVDRQASIAMSGEEFRRVGHRLVDQIADFLDSLPDRPVTRATTPAEARRLLDAQRPLPATGEDAGVILDRAAEALFDHSLFNGHPRFWGYITSSPAPIGILGDLLAAATNPNLGAWRLSPMATQIELQTVRWMASLIGYPETCGGLFVSGGNMANITALIAARVARAKPELRSKGLYGSDNHRMRVYASSETHTWIQKATDICGMGTDAIHWIPVDEDLRIDVEALKRAIESDLAAGDRPFMVIGTAGTVSTGAIDPLQDLAGICREHDLWYHVDGAYGGFAAALPELAEQMAGMSDADSVAIDPHKWLYSPLEAGCVLVRDFKLLRDAFSYQPPYYHFDSEAINFVEHGPQNSRGFRALKTWLSLQHVGRDGYERLIRDDIALARVLYDLVEKRQDMEALAHGLSITSFRYVPVDLAGRTAEEPVAKFLNELNQEILVRVEKSGEAFVSLAVIGETFALRLCVVNFRTTRTDIEALPEIIARIGSQADRDLRPKGL